MIPSFPIYLSTQQRTATLSCCIMIEHFMNLDVLCKRQLAYWAGMENPVADQEPLILEKENSYVTTMINSICDLFLYLIFLVDLLFRCPSHFEGKTLFENNILWQKWTVDWVHRLSLSPFISTTSTTSARRFQH